MNRMEESFKNYFSTQDNKVDTTGIIASQKDVTYTYNKKETNPRKDIEKNNFSISDLMLMADSNIDSIDQLCNILKRLLNAAWGSDWGEISPDLKKGEDSSKIKIPQITAEINNREIAEKMPLKPVLINTVKEVVEGQPTGDTLLVYRHWFDCVVEFDFYGRTSKEAREILNKFEMLLTIYSGYLKRLGISEILFLKEVSARNSLNFVEQTPMKCLMYWVRFERITPIRQSLINTINSNIGIKKIDDESIKTVIEANRNIRLTQEPAAEIDFDFSDIDTGVEFSDDI